MKTLILWTDAFRYSYLNEEDTPFLYSLTKRFGIGKLKPPFGYSSIGASFYTGVYPTKHGQLNLFQYGYSPKKLKDYWFLKYTPDRVKHYMLDLYRYYIEKNDFLMPNINYELAKNFSCAQEKFYVHKNSLNFPTLFDYLKENNLSYMVYNWPYVATDKWTKLTFTLKSNDEFKTKEFLELIQYNSVDLYMIHMWDLDKYGHIYGPNSTELKNILRIQDRLLESITSKFSIENDNIIIWSDHGMLTVEDTLDISPYISTNRKENGKEFIHFLDSTMARFWFFDNNEKDKILNELNSSQKGHILSKEEKIKFNINFTDNRYGDEIFLANKGVLLCPNFFQDIPIKGMHGYDLTDEREHGIFILNRQTKKEKGDMVDLLPTILKMLNIQIPQYIDGIDLLV